MSQPISSVKKFEIAPMNQSSGDATFSYVDGNPLVQFEIGASDLYLMSSHLRLCFRLQLTDGAGARPNNNDQTGAGNQEVLINNKVGVASVIDNITISNLQNNVLEYCRAYPRLLATLIPSGAGFSDYSTYLGQQFGSTSNREVQGRLCNTGGDAVGRSFIEVSMPLLCGIFLNGENIPLSFQSGTGGLRIAIQLAPSIQALFGSTGNTVNSQYKLSRVSLMGSYGVPQGGRLPAIKALPFSAFQNFYSVINNGDNTQQINPALNAVVSTFTNFVPTEHISNYGQDAYKTTPLLNKSTAAGNPQVNLAPIEGIDFIRSGIKFPLQFKVDEKNVVRFNAAGAAGNQYAGSTFEAQRQLYFQNAMRPIVATTTCLAGANSEGLTIANADVNHNSTTGVGTNGFQNCYGVGVRYDAVNNGSTASFMGRPFSMRIQSKLDGNSPMSGYSYFLYRGMVNFDSNGIISVSN